MTPEEFQRLAGMFEVVISRPPGQRTACIAALASGNAELRRELQTLVHHHRDDDFLESPLFEDSDTPLRPGKRLAHYTIERELGRGGMGVVYLARDTRLDRPVAIKALRSSLLRDPKHRARFRREAKAAASISHGAVATIYAFEEIGGNFYIVSEFVPGETLTTVLEARRLRTEEALDLAVRLAGGLAAAHSGGVVHRDLKPHNVIWTPGDGPKIVDFGLARTADSGTASQRLTETGLVLGSPAYMAPEQLQGHVVDRRADIFSFGILLYEIVAGRHPFRRNTAAGTTAAILRNPPPPVEGAAPELQKVIHRCLQKAPADRYGSGQEVADALARLMHDPGNRATRLDTRWWTFHQFAAILVYAVTITALWPVRNLAVPPLVLAALAAAIANGTLRSHLLFTSRFNAVALPDQLRRVQGWLRRIDWIFSGLLMPTALLLLSAVPLIAGMLLAVSVGYGVVFLAIEPATAAAIVPER